MLLQLKALYRPGTEPVHMLYVQLRGGGGRYCSVNGANRRIFIALFADVKARFKGLRVAVNDLLIELLRVGITTLSSL